MCFTHRNMPIVQVKKYNRLSIFFPCYDQDFHPFVNVFPKKRLWDCFVLSHQFQMMCLAGISIMIWTESKAFMLLLSDFDWTQALRGFFVIMLDQSNRSSWELFWFFIFFGLFHIMWDLAEGLRVDLNESKGLPPQLFCIQIVLRAQFHFEFFFSLMRPWRKGEKKDSPRFQQPE